MCSQEVRPETVFKKKKKKKKKRTLSSLCALWFKLSSIGRSNTSLKSFIFCVQSGGTAGDCILFKFIKTNFVSLCSLWFKPSSIGRTRV